MSLTDLCIFTRIWMNILSCTVLTSFICFHLHSYDVIIAISFLSLQSWYNFTIGVIVKHYNCLIITLHQGCLEDIGRSHRSYYYRMKRYLYDFWNVVDLLSYVLLIAALFVRHFYIDESFTIARRMFALSLLVMYLRFLEVFLIHRKLGPTLIMIKEMVYIYIYKSLSLSLF